MTDAPTSKQGDAAPAMLLQDEYAKDNPFKHVNITNDPPPGMSEGKVPGGKGGHYDEQDGAGALGGEQGLGQAQGQDALSSEREQQGLGQTQDTVSGDQGQQGLGQDTTTHSRSHGQQGLGQTQEQDALSSEREQQGLGQTQEQGRGGGLGQQDETRDREPSHFQAAPGMPATGRKDLIKVPVHVDSHLAEMSDEETEADKGGPLKKIAGALGKVKKLRGDKDTAIGNVITLEMTREEYNKYWKKDEQGNYAGTEPEGEGRRLWADQLKAGKST